LPLPQVLLYAAILFFVAAVAVRATRYARHPVHLHWELYPVAHEKGRAAYGGSHYEEPEHWQKARRVDHAGEARAMAAEIFLLEGVRHHNKPLWRVSWPFHVGVYLAIGWLALLLIAGGIWAAGPVPAPVTLIIDAIGFAGLGLGLIGAVGLLGRRLLDPDLRAYNAPADLVNLLAWIVYLGWSLGVHAVEGGFGSLVAFSGALVRGQAAVLSTPIAVEIVLGALLLAYLPLTRMFHFVAKYFLYHDVRWEDAPNPRGGALEQRLQRAMDFGVGWQAPHVAAARSWGEAAAGGRGPVDEEQR
jgi:nitrate reductase gamma subunit